jgi:hypothetical protein
MRELRFPWCGIHAVLLSLAVFASGGCSSDILGDDPSTGIDLTVVKGPINPVEREGEDNTLPVDGAKVELQRLGGGRHTVRTDESGSASVSLVPGSYVVTVTECPLTLALPDPDTVQVVSGERRSLRQECDTGIR